MESYSTAEVWRLSFLLLSFVIQMGECCWKDSFRLELHNDLNEKGDSSSSSSSSSSSTV